MVVAQFKSGISEEIRGKVFGVPNPPATIAAALTATTTAEAEKTPLKMLIGVVDNKETKEDKQEEEDTVIERMVKIVDVLAISRRQGSNSRQQRTRGQGNRNTNQYINNKCYDCGTMGHLRRQCNKPQTPFSGRGRGGPSNRFTSR